MAAGYDHRPGAHFADTRRGLTRIIDPRMVFTVEPGLYFIESLLADLQKSENAKYVNWTKVDDFRKFGGIRIEDDVVVRDGGIENMTSVTKQLVTVS